MTGISEEGFGLMSQQLFDVFNLSKCLPKCHICYNSIEIGNEFRLKPFARNRNNRNQTLSIMVCISCDKENKPLPYWEYRKALESLNYKIPKSNYLIENLEFKLKWWNSHSKDDRELYGLRRARIGMTEKFYFQALEEYQQSSQEFLLEYEQLFDNIDYITQSRLDTERHQKEIEEKRKNYVGGCFVLSSGAKEIIIPSQ